MEGTVEFLGLMLGLALVALIVLPIIALARARRAARLGKRNEEGWQNLTQRVHALETQVQELQGRLKAWGAVGHVPREVAPAVAAAEIPSPATPALAEVTHPPVVAVGAHAPTIEPPRPAATVAPLGAAAHRASALSSNDQTGRAICFGCATRGAVSPQTSRASCCTTSVPNLGRIEAFSPRDCQARAEHGRSSGHRLAQQARNDHPGDWCRAVSGL